MKKLLAIGLTGVYTHLMATTATATRTTGPALQVTVGRKSVRSGAMPVKNMNLAAYGALSALVQFMAGNAR